MRSVRGHSRGRKGSAPSRVRAHSRSGKPAILGGKRDKWPPPHPGMSREALMKYEQRLRKEIADLGSGNFVPTHPGHPAFIRRRLIQVRKLLASAH